MVLPDITFSVPVPEYVADPCWSMTAYRGPGLLLADVVMVQFLMLFLTPLLDELTVSGLVCEVAKARYETGDFEVLPMLENSKVQLLITLSSAPDAQRTHIPVDALLLLTTVKF